MKAPLLLGTASVIVLLLGSAPPAAKAATSRILYGCGPNLCDIQADGKNRRALTRDGTWRKPYAFPSRSRSGKRMAFVGRDQYVHVSTGLARDRRRLVHTGRPRIHPGGKRVLVSTFGRDGVRICTVAIGGGTYPCVYGGSYWNWGMGSRLVAPASDPDYDDHVKLYELDLDGLREVGIVARPRAGHRFRGTPSVSPDGRLLAVPELPPSPDEVRIALYRTSTGEHVRDLTRGHGDVDPSWSPDGAELVFVRDPKVHEDVYGTPAIGRIVRIARGGGPVRTVVRAGRHPYWGS